MADPGYWCERDALIHPEYYPAFSGSDKMAPFQPNELLSSLNAWWLANASHLAYSDEQKLDQELELQGFSLRRFFNRHGSQAYLAENDHVAVLAFRGTRRSEFSNLRNDIDIRHLSLIGNVYVHHGFYRSLMAIWPDIDAALENIDKPLWYTGHSLGGAMALLATLLRRPQATHVFGAPRVGNASFAKLLDSLPIACYVHCCDIVPCLPPTQIGFADTGKERRLTADRRLLSNPTPQQRRVDWLRGQFTFLRRLSWARPDCVGLRSLSDHIVLNYSDAIRRIIT